MIQKINLFKKYAIKPKQIMAITNGDPKKNEIFHHMVRRLNHHDKIFQRRKYGDIKLGQFAEEIKQKELKWLYS